MRQRVRAFVCSYSVALVHVAINKYVLTKSVPDVSDALERLLGVDVRAYVHKSALDSPNEFRRCFLYSKEVNAVLKWHELSLRNIFDAIAACGTESPKTLIELEAFLQALASVEIIAVDATERDCSGALARPKTVLLHFLSKLANLSQS